MVDNGNARSARIEFFKPLNENASRRDIWLWWEYHRIIYNVIAFLTAFASIAIFENLANDITPPGQDAVEPITILVVLFVAIVGWNVCYCLGYLIDEMYKDENGTKGPMLWIFGTIFSIAVLMAPVSIFALAGTSVH